MLALPVSRRLPALDAMDSPPRIGGLERHGTDQTKPLVSPAFVVFTLIIGHTTGSLGLSHWLEQKRVVSLFDPYNVAPVVLVPSLAMRGIRTPAICGDNDLELGVILTHLGDEALGRVAFTVIVLGASLLDQRLGHKPGQDILSTSAEIPDCIPHQWEV